MYYNFLNLFDAEVIETIIHHDICPWLIGQDSRNIELISRTLLTPYVGFHSASAEVRAASAIDIALWDLAGKRHGIPVYEALGGASHASIQVYNICSISLHIRSTPFCVCFSSRTRSAKMLLYILSASAQ